MSTHTKQIILLFLTPKGYENRQYIFLFWYDKSPFPDIIHIKKFTYILKIVMKDNNSIVAMTYRGKSRSKRV